ncbi:MAG: hypothetical protein LH605_09440, partial [Microbacteriaceae bacterium]|nr:hypothetical protein [Microbacteriaceae bacterium]
MPRDHLTADGTDAEGPRHGIRAVHEPDDYAAVGCSRGCRTTEPPAMRASLGTRIPGAIVTSD